MKTGQGHLGADRHRGARRAGPAPRAPRPVRRSTRFEIDAVTTQAGGHPDIYGPLRVRQPQRPAIPAPTCDCQDARDFELHLPAGFIGDPHAMPHAPRPTSATTGRPSRSASQVGGGRPSASKAARSIALQRGPVPAQAGLLAFLVPRLGSPVYLAIEPRTGGDYGLDGSARRDRPFPAALLRRARTLGSARRARCITPERSPTGCEPFYRAVRRRRLDRRSPAAAVHATTRPPAANR